MVATLFLKIPLYYDDGQVEVVEAKYKKFLIGVKFHPELLVDEEDKFNDIFKTLIEKSMDK